MEKKVLYLALFVLLVGVAQAESLEQNRVNSIVVSDISSIKTDYVSHLEDSTETFSNSLSDYSVNVIFEQDNTKLFLLILCVSIFLIPIIINLVRLKKNENKTNFYINNYDIINE